MHLADDKKDQTYSVLKVKGMTAAQAVKFVLLLTIGIVLTIAFGIWWIQPGHIPRNFGGAFHPIDYALFLILTFVVWHQISMELLAWYAAVYIAHPDRPASPQPDLRVAYLTAFVPGAEPYSILEKTLKAMTGVAYPHDTWLLDEGNDDEAKKICERYGVFHFSRKGRDEFNTAGGQFAAKTKGGNYNAWLHHYAEQYDIVAQHDVDFIPRKDYLMRTLGFFRDPDVAFVGTPQVYGNQGESWIARGAAEQTYGFYGTMQKGFFAHDMTLLIGANHIMRITAYQDIGGYTAHITEDMLTGMKLYARGNKWKSVYVPEILLVGEGPTTWSAYFGQQMRWAYGCMDILFRHCPSLMPKMKFRHIFNYLWLQQFYFSGLAQVVGVLLLTTYFFFGVAPASMSLLPILILYLPLVAYQVLFQLWLQKFNCDPKTERGLLLRGKLLSLAVWPIYFLAFVGVVRGQRLSYVVTPKGGQEENTYVPSLFHFHFILGSLTLIDIAAGFYRSFTSPVMLFWAILNTIFMYYFFLAEAAPPFVMHVRKALSLSSQRWPFLRKNASISITQSVDVKET
jgi:cellulose synthase/poly-beta-1,6-N-acetylglucosamine synthase-like glycosyltransferase